MIINTRIALLTVARKHSRKKRPFFKEKKISYCALFGLFQREWFDTMGYF